MKRAKLNYEKIARKRFEIDMTQKELAEKADLSVSTIKMIETGRTDTTYENIEKIAKVLDLNISDIYIPNYRDTKVISIVNNKGGVGKTSICGNIAYAISEMDYKVLLIDADMQQNLTQSFNMEDTEDDKHLGNAIRNSDILIPNNSEMLNYIKKTNFENIDFIVSDISMSSIEMELSLKIQRETILKGLLKGIIEKGIYDFILIDTNPVLGMLNYNVLNASDFVLIPIELSKFAINGLDVLLSYIESVKITNPILKVAGVIINKYDLREKEITTTCEDIVMKVFNDEVNIFNTRMGVDTSLKKSQLRNCPVLVTEKTSRISKQFRELSKEVLKVVETKY